MVEELHGRIEEELESRIWWKNDGRTVQGEIQ
jgi:hypothetical protein